MFGHQNHQDSPADGHRAEDQAVLDTVRVVLMAGTRLAPSDIRAISHLMTVGGRSDPRGVTAAYPTHPVCVADEPVDVDFERPRHSGEERYSIVRGMAEGGFSA